MQVDENFPEVIAEHLGQEVGMAVRSERERQGLSQADVAARLKLAGLNWHQTTVAKTERGERPLKLQEAVILAWVLGVPLVTTILGTRLEKYVAASLAERFIQRMQEQREAARTRALADYLETIPEAARPAVEAKFKAELQEMEDELREQFGGVLDMRGQELFPESAAAFDLADEAARGNAEERDDG